MKQTIKEAILKSLEDIGALATYSQVCKHIIEQQYYDFGLAKTPQSTVSAILGTFIREGDSRVRRIKESNGSFVYYLAKNEANLNLNLEPLSDASSVVSKNTKKALRFEQYRERSLHRLLSSYLKNAAVYTKTIYHEQSNAKDSNQKWIHPDIVGVEFLKLKNETSQNFLKSINRLDTFKISSYEIKREVRTDSELKEAFFQAVSNSSWANYGYLVAFDFSDNLTDEISRLNQLFGIGIIELNANPYKSKILFPATYRNLDFKTIDKLCKINHEFERFIEYVEKTMSANEKYLRGAEKELDDFCDDYFESDSQIEAYCKENRIPMDDFDFEVPE